MATTTKQKDAVEDVDELRRMAEEMRDDECFEVSISGWEKTDGKYGAPKVKVTFVKPNFEEETIILDWPQKPTEDNKFIRLCVDALGVDNPRAAALRADELKNPDHESHTVLADVKDGEWELIAEKPQSGLRKYIPSPAESKDGQLKWYSRTLYTLLGPLSLLFLPILFVMDEPGVWFNNSDSSADVYWSAQAMFHSAVGTFMYYIIWLIFAL